MWTDGFEMMEMAPTRLVAKIQPKWDTHLYHLFSQIQIWYSKIEQKSHFELYNVTPSPVFLDTLDSLDSLFSVVKGRCCFPFLWKVERSMTFFESISQWNLCWVLTDKLTMHYTCRPALTCNGRRKNQLTVYARPHQIPQWHEWRRYIAAMITYQNRGPTYAIF